MKTKPGLNIKIAVFSALFGFIMGLSFVLGYELEKYGMTLPGFSGKAKILLFSLLIMIPVGIISFFLFSFLTAYEYKKKAAVKPSKFFLISFLSIVICRIPVFLAYYPAVMSYDFGR